MGSGSIFCLLEEIDSSSISYSSYDVSYRGIKSELTDIEWPFIQDLTFVEQESQKLGSSSSLLLESLPDSFLNKRW